MLQLLCLNHLKSLKQLLSHKKKKKYVYAIEIKPRYF